MKNLLKSFFPLTFLIIFVADVNSQNTATTTVLTNVRLIDGTGSPAKQNQDILIRGETIQSVGQDLEIPPNTRVIDLEGKTVLPGLINMHGHIYTNTGGDTGGNQPSYLPLYLAGGVTTIYSPGELNADSTLSLKREIENGQRDGPQILTAGPYFDNAPSKIPWIKGSKSLDSIRSQFNKWKNVMSGVKVYTSIMEQQLKLITKLADKENIPVTGHLGSITASHAIDLGIDGLEHGIFGMPEFFKGEYNPKSIACNEQPLDMNDPQTASLIQKIVNQQIYITPTIITFRAMLKNFKPVTSGWQKYLTSEAQNGFDQLYEYIISKPDVQNCVSNAIQKQQILLNEIYRRGGRIVTGTDPVGPNLILGYGIHREMKLLADAGIPPMAVIQAATSNAAKALGKFDQFGSITIGKEADLLVVDGNPDDKITDIGTTVMVFSDGRQYNPKALRKSAIGSIGKE